VPDEPEAFEEEDDWDLRYRPEAEVYADARPELDRPHQRETRADRYAPIAVSDSMFSPEPPRAPSRRWAALATVAIVVGGGAATIYGLRSDAMSRLSGQISLPSFAAASAGQRAPLELLSLRHAAERSGAFTVTGLVQNPLAGNAVSDVVAVVYLFDREGRYFTSGKVALPSGLAPGEEAPFVISIDDARGVGRYRVGFRLENGGVVAHVDRRGQEPAGTTGDTVEESGPAAAVPTSTRGRVEGN
jgi:hypothetical protein